jgi:hypothetical protein
MGKRHKDEKIEEKKGEEQDDFTLKKTMKESYSSEKYTDGETYEQKHPGDQKPLEDEPKEMEKEGNPPEQGEEYRKDAEDEKKEEVPEKGKEYRKDAEEHEKKRGKKGDQIL